MDRVIEDGGGRRQPPPSLFRLLGVFVKMSLLGFGGPNAHLALMLDEVVERRRWRGALVAGLGVAAVLSTTAVAGPIAGAAKAALG